jgi:hypothetical protein
MNQPEARHNPFRYGALATDEAFADREAEVAEIKDDVANGQDVVVFAPRRYGKSSLIRQVSRECVDVGALVGYVDLMTAPTREKLAEKLARTIHDDVASPLFRARERLRVFSGLRIRPTVTVDPEDGSLSFSFEAEPAKEDIDATIEELLRLPGRLGAERERRVALVMDEFQEIVEIAPYLPRLMRSVFQEQPEVAHVYLGSKRHMMEAIFSDQNEPFWRSAKQLELGVIAPKLFQPHIHERFLETDREVEPDALEQVLALTGGHPYATQELCYFLWQETPQKEAATPERLAEALTKVLRSEHAHFSLVWERAASAQRLVLMALAREGPGHPLTRDYRRRHRLPGSGTVQKALTALIRVELVVREGRGRYRIAEPFLSDWILRNET